MIRVVCNYQTGGVFTEDYVSKLYNMLKRNASYEFVFTCYTNVARLDNFYRRFKRNIEQPDCMSWEIEKFAVDYLWGWWCKLPLFSIDDCERVIYIDLDVVILNNVDFLFHIQDDFAILRRPLNKMNCFNGTLITWKPQPVIKNLWDGFHPSMLGQYKSDQDYLQYNLGIPATFIDTPGIISYKHMGYIEEIEGKDINPSHMKIIYCHGTPKPHELTHLDWVQEHWR